MAFYDALEVNDAVMVLGEPTLQQIARELVESVRANTSIDWTIKEPVRAKLRVIVMRILRKHGYQPDKHEKATQTVIEQAELLRMRAERLSEVGNKPKHRCARTCAKVLAQPMQP